MAVTYHNGALLEDDLHLSILWSQTSKLACRVNSGSSGLTVVLTAEDVGVEGFYWSCGFHRSDAQKKSVFVWVGNSATQCPGRCAWPCHQPIYGPQTPPLVAPNADVGIDGMVINIAGLLAGAVTNPFGKGYFQGSADAPLEAASACPGAYGKGAYPGYAGDSCWWIRVRVRALMRWV
ncbi:hypothetical protein RHSIM_Rhsim06G0080000 [Rhododendron simsii]|uniref:Uncharacterized protein n=1 Tax=Rhododendron simsii TaxID=118357 RepID=A0A834LK52_RHOSS|nr:hypothetical protein RHSIM_Rhsim06G0080000 [Rhododendron simsii]